MSKTEAAEIPDTVVVSPQTESVHRQGDGIEPACVDRLHHVDHDETEWRLTQEPLTDAADRCGHPECFQDEQPVTDGGETEVTIRRSDHISMETFVDAIANQVQAPERVRVDAHGIADRAIKWYSGQYTDDEIGTAALYLSALLHDADPSQRRLSTLTEISKQDLRETYLALGNDPEVLPHWYADTREPEEDGEGEEEDPEADDSESMGLIDRLKSLLQTDGDEE